VTNSSADPRRRYLFGGLVGLLTVPLLAASSCDSSSGTNPTDAPTSAASASSAATPSAKPTATPVAARKVSGVAKTIGAGTFAGGTDIAVGLYVVTCGAGQSGNFIVSGTDSYDEILGGGSAFGGVPKIRVQISTGDQIQISGLSVVHFAPVSSPYITAHKTGILYAGTFTVGQDIGAGRYVATPGAGQSGNFIVSGNDSYDEILGDPSADGGVPNVSVTLTDGDIIDISGLSQVTLTASG